MSAIDLFAGAGGFSLAAHRLGLDILAAVELDPTARATYRANIVEALGHEAVIEEDILDVVPSELRGELGLEPGQLGILLGGPPCQGFSTHRINNAGVADPRNELLLRYFDFVNEFLPSVFLVENVPGLLWPRHKKFLDDFKALADESGYTLFGPERINAKNYGVPQNRERVFILGVRDGVDTVGLTWPPEPTHMKPGIGLPEWLNASKVFEEPGDEVRAAIAEIIGEEVTENLVFGEAVLPLEQDPSAVHMNHGPDLLLRLTQTPINGSRSDVDIQLDCHKDHSGHKDVYGRIKLAQPGPTMTTGCINPSRGRFLHPWLDHGMTARHAARFQTFPDTYIFSGGITSQGKQIGNAVPVRLGEALIAEALALLD